MARTEENSRHLARLFDWGTIAVAGVAGAVAVAGLMASALDQPLRKVELALHGSPH